MGTCTETRRLGSRESSATNGSNRPSFCGIGCAASFPVNASKATRAASNSSSSEEMRDPSAVQLTDPHEQPPLHSLRWPTAPAGVAVDAVDAAVEAAEAAAVAGAAEAAAMVAAMAVPRPAAASASSWR